MYLRPVSRTAAFAWSNCESVVIGALSEKKSLPARIARTPSAHRSLVTAAEAISRAWPSARASSSQRAARACGNAF